MSAEGHAPAGAATERSAPPLARVARHARGLLLVTHPLPSSLYVLGVAAFALLAAAASGRPLRDDVLARVLVGVACAQMAIGALNDYRDRARDRLTRPEKPLARGVIAPAEALALCLLATGVVIALGWSLGPLPGALLLLVEGLGVAYDLWFKGTLVTALLYAVYFPLVFVLPWAVFGRPEPFLPWVVPLGAWLGLSMSIANALPDLEGDAAAGLRGLPQVLGLRAGLWLTWLAPLVAAALLWALAVTGVVPARPLGLLVATGAAVLPVGASAALLRARPGAASLRVSFYLLALGVVALAVAWLWAVTG